MILALDNLALICIGIFIIWAAYLALPIFSGFFIWTVKGVLNIAKSCPQTVCRSPFFSFMFVIFAFSWPLIAGAVFIVFAMMLGDLGEQDEQTQMGNRA